MQTKFTVARIATNSGICLLSVVHECALIVERIIVERISIGGAIGSITLQELLIQKNINKKGCLADSPNDISCRY